MYYDKKGKPLTTKEFTKLLEDMEYRVIGQGKAPSGAHISTVWLGIDHSFGGDMPVIFETLVTYPNGDEKEMYRYTSEEEARAHHELLREDMPSNIKPVSRWEQIVQDID